jgi:hypothetical protein
MVVEPGDVDRALEEHLAAFFAGHFREAFTWDRGPIATVQPRFRALRFSPGPRTSLWTYCSIGAWEVGSGARRVEFAYLSEVAAPRIVELLAMLTYYHSKHSLAMGHSLPLGEPWLEGSTCDQLLISLPYPLGPDFEHCEVEGIRYQLLWALPITAAEREFKKAHGLDALEQRLEETGAEYWDPARKSAV